MDHANAQKGLDQAGKVSAKLIVLQAADADGDDLGKMAAALNAVKGAIRAGVLASEQNCVFLLAAADSAVTVERAVSYLDLAGYAVKEADDEVYTRVEAALASTTIDVPSSIAGPCAPQPPPTTTHPDVQLTSLSKSVEPLREAFNAAKGRYRFVALLSPT